MRDSVMNVLKGSDKALTIFEIADSIGAGDVESTKELLEVLQKLEEEAIIYHSNKDKYLLLENSHLRKGLMRANKKGFGFVEIDNMDEDVYISQDNMNGAIHDDIVLVEITIKMNIDRLEVRVLKILKRENKRFVGEINFDSKGVGHIT